MSDLHAAVGSYVLNALESDERAEFEQHLMQCETCRREVVEFGETSAELALLAATPPPPALRDSVLAQIRGVRVLPPADEPGAAVEPAIVSPPAVVDELAVRRSSRRNRVLVALVAAVAVIALGLGGVVWALVSAQQAQVAEQRLETQLFSASDLRSYPVSMKNGGRATFFVSRSQNRALFVAGDLPSVGDRTYQLWTVGSSGPRPDVLVGVGSGSTRQWLTTPVADARGVAVSVEQSGGSTSGQPSDDVQASANL